MEFIPFCGRTTETEEFQYVRSHLAPNKYPRDVRFIRSLPEIASGKLDRGTLEELGQ